MREEIKLRKEITLICHKMYEKDLISATDGNVSARLSDGSILITPSGLAKGDISPEEMLRIDMEGKKLSGFGKPSSETNMHLEVYRVRPDVMAVVHAHPPTAVAFSIAGISLAGCVIPEVILTMGEIPTVPYATPGTGEAGLVIREPLANFDAMILDRHGSITVGKNLQKAYHHLEKIEHAARVTLAARQLGQVQTLPGAEVKKLIDLREKFGIQVGLPRGCNECGLCDTKGLKEKGGY